jgi:ATP-dependent Clp protease ATP-binding subunit ClpA
MFERAIYFRLPAFNETGEQTMFERYTEKARRVVFFAWYEASHYGSPYIETEHLLFGLLREEPRALKAVRGANQRLGGYSHRNRETDY